MKSILRNFFLFATVALLLQGSAKAQVVTTHATGTGYPEGMLIGTLDTLYVFDLLTYSMVKIDPLGASSAFVGSGGFGNTDGTGAAASFSDVYFMVRDATGNIYATDYSNGKIRKITPAGVVTTFVTGLAGPSGIVWGKDDTLLVVVNPASSAIIKIDPLGGVTTFATLPAFTMGLAKGSNDTLYAAGYSGSQIYKIDPLGTATVLAGSGAGGSADGTGLAASFQNPESIVIDGAGNLFVSDVSNYRIRQVTPAGVVSTYAGSGTNATTNGTGTAAEFSYPWAMQISPSTGAIFISELGSGAIRKMTGGVPLPLSWLSLSANLSSQGNAQIAWQVNETAVKNYTLQKSTDGRQYMPIGNVGSKGNGTQKYSYTEASALYGTAYYRIQQVDVDGKSTFSATLKLNNTTTAAEALKVYPTQVVAGFSISSTAAQSAQLINNVGQVVQTINIVAGVQQVSMAALPAGIYYVKSDNGSAQRIVKL